MIKRILIDTNLIVRYLIKDNKEQFKFAEEFFELVRIGKVKAYLEQTVFTETIFVLSNIYLIPRETIASTLFDLIMYKGIFNSEKDVLIESLNIFSDTKLHIVDCILVAKAKLEKIEIKTFDKELIKYSIDN